ncbi:MAG: hypothetical protein NVS4B2_23090 [Chloroflexota bacterium]
MVALFVAGCGGHRASATPAVAVVAGQRIDATELQHYLNYVAQYYSRSPAQGQQTSMAHCSARTVIGTCTLVKRQVLGRLLQESVVLAYARGHHITLGPADTAQVARALQDGSLVHTGDSSFLHDVLTRELLVQKVMQRVLPPAAKRGPSVHIRKYYIPFASVKYRSAAYHEALVLATDGQPVPDNARVRDEWQADFRLPPKINQALAYASPGQFVGPFAAGDHYQVVQLVKRSSHAYGAPARNALATRYFHIWLTTQMARTRPQCFDARGKSTACPL